MAQLGGGSFSGRAIYDSSGGSAVFDGIAEDVSDIISMISPFETPLLAALGDAQFPARNVLHEWLEDALGPNTIINSTAVASTTANTTITIKAGLAKFLAVGMILRAPEATGAEFMQIASISGNDIVVTRAFAGTTANSFAIASSISIIVDAALDGSDVVGDTSRPRVRKSNYTQIIKKDVIISGTMRAVTQLGGISDEWDYQIQQRLRETIRDLEKAVILSRLSTNTLGSSSAYRTMSGLLQQIVTNVDSWGTTLTDSGLTSSIKKAWDTGGTDVDLIVCGDTVKRQIDGFNSTRLVVNQGQGDAVFRNLVSIFECTYGSLPVLMTRWMPPTRYMVISTQRIEVPPLQNRSFSFSEVARTGDANKGMILGEYTTVLRNEEGMVQGSV